MKPPVGPRIEAALVLKENGELKMCRRQLRLRACALAISGLFVLAVNPALAAEYSGTWAADLATCKVGQDSPDAPVVLTAKGYDQHEAHCSFEGLEPSGPGEWSGKASCSVEGDAQSFAVKLTVSGDTLTLTEDGAARDLLRCP
jgi:hypothetical protein